MSTTRSLAVGSKSQKTCSSKRFNILICIDQATKNINEAINKNAHNSVPVDDAKSNNEKKLGKIYTKNKPMNA